jgi:hypothetical protein
MWEYRTDESRTAAAYQVGVFRDVRQRSHYNNSGHVFLYGIDMAAQWERLYQERRGVCEACGVPRERGQLDLDHTRGNTKKTRCSCLHNCLADGTVCTGIRLLCTMDPKKGALPDNCHSRRHGRVLRFGEHQF